jgi:hypothetical protein
MMVDGKKRQKVSLSSVLPEIVRSQGWEKQLELYTLFSHWREVVDEQFATYAWPQKVDRGVLWLEVENSSWLQQFQYQKIELLATLNRALRLSRLKDIRMVLPSGSAEQAVPAANLRLRFIKPDQEKVAAFRRQVETIADPECREALFRLWYLDQACRQEKSAP